MKGTLTRFWRLLRALSPNCREAARLQSLALDRTLPAVERFGLSAHLLGCRWCRRYRKQLLFLRRAAQKHDLPSAPAPAHRLSPDASQRIRDSLRSQPSPDAGRPSPEP